MWTKKEMCEMTMTTPDALRFYEKIGLLSPKRLDNNYRVYTQVDYRTIQYIKVLQYIGFTLSEISELLLMDAMEINEECNANTIEIFSNKISQIEYKVNIYNKVLDVLKTYMSGRSEVMNSNNDEITNFTDEKVNTIFEFLKERDFK